MKCLKLYIRIFAVFCVLWPGIRGAESEVYYDNEVHTCKSNEYFDVDYLKCFPCEKELNLVPSKDKLSCVCFPVHTERAFYDNLEQHSICDVKQRQNATTKDPPKLKCPTLFFNLSRVRQQSRNVKMFRVFEDKDVSRSGSCQCDERTNVLYRQIYCIPHALLKEYNSYGNLAVSRNHQENLKALLFLCHTMKLRRECNYLANLCVLLEFSLDRQSPCTVFYSAQINDYTSEATRRIKPNLFYKKGRNTIEDINKKLDQSFRIHRGKDLGIGLGLNFTILEFKLAGDLLKFGKSSLKQLNLCSTNNEPMEIHFAKNVQQNCRLSLEETIENSRETTFNSIFIQYFDGKTMLLKRIPILIRNLFQNRDRDSNRWQFVSRFHLIDTISGHRPGLMDNPYSERNMVKKFESVRFLTRAELRFEVRDSNKIETPILVLEYKHVNLSSSPGNDVLYDFEFRINFEKSLSFDTLLEICLPILLIFGLILSVAESISHKLRQGKDTFDWDILLHFIIQLCSKVANTLFILACGIAIYIHIVYKTQSTVKILLPDSIQSDLKAFFIVALILKLVKLTQHLHKIANVDIFFIDCERPKLGESFHVKTLQNHHLETPSSMGSRSINLESNVSAWRNYFIANEWLKLTTRRPISVSLHLLLTVALLHVLGMENFATLRFYFHLARTEATTATTTTATDSDVILKVSTGLICFLLSYTVQWLINYVVWERYIKHPVQQFIDVCSVANVSVFLFSDRCYGHYIHGRSPHGFADTDVCSMMLQFKREEENMCGHRGLLPGSENQTYRVLAPKNLRSLYDKLVLPMQKPSLFANLTSQGRAGAAFQFERTSGMYQSINRFFVAFIDHSLKDLDYVVRERTILEWVLNMELELSAISDDRGIFYMDSGNSFSEILFYGSESLLIQFEIMLFAVVVSISGCFLTATVIVGLTYKVLKFIIATAAKYNLGRKTLIDQRFLI